MAYRILIATDEPKMAGALQARLRQEGYEAGTAATGEDAFFLIETQRFDVILLDLMLPGRDGLEILTAIRKRHIETPVLILTAEDTLTRRVMALNLGADDYMARPFAFEELLARISALLRRSRIRLYTKELEIDLLTRSVTRTGQAITLTEREFKVLEYLIRHQGRVVPREDLARNIWMDSADTPQINNIIDVYVGKLRRKIEPPGSAKLIHTVRGMGFMLNP